MRKFVPLILIGGLTAAAALAPSWAESSPEAKPWLEKMAAIQKQGPFRVNYEATMQIEQGGQTMSVSMDGTTTHLDPKRTRSEMTMRMEMPQLQQPMNMTMLTVGDGSTMWMEMTNPMMGGKQVMKLPLDKLDEMAQMSQQMGLGFASGGADPLQQLEQMIEMFDFNVVGVADGKVTLRATMTEETRAKMGAGVPAGLSEALNEMTFVLDEKTGFPEEMRSAGDPPTMRIRFKDMTKLKDGEIEAGLFAYSPPDGVQVIDLGAMLQSAGSVPSSE